jgi:threonine dehydratase
MTADAGAWLPSLEELRAAREIVDRIARRTPVLRSSSLSARTGADVWLKAEHLQLTGSFKIRGAVVRLARLSEEERARGVVAASAGNHAQGVARAARSLGISARIYMPADAALPKLAATRDYGAEVVPVEGRLSAALEAAIAECESSGRTLIHPFDHEDIVCGQASVGLEILEQVPDATTIVVPTGGGGLLAGVAAAAAVARPGVRVVGVQAEKAAAWPGSMTSGRPVALADTHTMADGIAVARPGDVPFGVVSALGPEIRTVTEEQLSRGLLHMTERAKQVIEPSAAAGVAAVLARPEDFSDGPTVVLLSGGNVDPLVLLRVVRHGLVAAGRFVTLRFLITDEPGELAGVLDRLGALGVNVLSVEHSRTAPSLEVDQVELTVEVEAKGPDHEREIREALARDGWTLLAP